MSGSMVRLFSLFLFGVMFAGTTRAQVGQCGLALIFRTVAFQ
jgi:hypothetical protein